MTRRHSNATVIFQKNKGQCLYAQSNSALERAFGPYGRIDVENPAPGQRARQIHWQDADDSDIKYYYDPEKGCFYKQSNGDPAPGYVQDLLKRPDVKKAIEKVFKYLGI